jgi:uncharacterized integral membrane protein
MNTKVIVLIVLIFLSVVIMLQNTQDTILKILFWSFGIPRILLIFITLLVGFSIGYVAAHLKSSKTNGEE